VTVTLPLVGVVGENESVGAGGEYVVVDANVFIVLLNKMETTSMMTNQFFLFFIVFPLSECGFG
jgi:hypothetical protein